MSKYIDTECSSQYTFHVESGAVNAEKSTPSVGFTASAESIAVRRLLDASSAADRAMSRRLGLRSMDMTAMSILTSSRDDIGPRELSQRLGITPAAATELVDRLEHAGHLIRSRSVTDRRRVHLTPTASALAEVQSHLRDLVQSIGAIGSRYSESERSVIVDYLTQVTAEFDRFSAER
jgi:DNA-binding MarR family transcriptional regulator